MLDYNLLRIFVLKHSNTDENIKTTAIIEDNAKQEDKEKQKQEPTAISIPRLKSITIMSLRQFS